MDALALYILICIIIVGLEVYKSPSLALKTKTTVTMMSLCVLPLIVMFVTFHQCYTLSVGQNRFVEWCNTPWVSFMGVYQPTIFALGLTLTAVIMLLINFVFVQRVLLDTPYLLKHTALFSASTNEWMDWMLRNNLDISAILIIITGWINVDHETVIEFLSVDIQKMNFLNIGWKADVHVGSVLIFFALLLSHNIIVVLRLNVGLNRYMIYSYLYKIAVIIAISWGLLSLFFSLFYVVYVADTTTHKGLQSFYDTHNTVGFSQYVVIFGYGFFWASYAIDYVIMQYSLRKRNE